MRHLILRESGGQVMDQNERHMIDDLFDRLRKADEQAEPRDPDAEALIARHVARQPAASYYMAQTIVVQQEALGRAQTKFQELERRLAERRSGGFLSGLFGGEEAATSGAPARGERTPGAFGRYHQPAPGGGFFAGAMQTALGVAGGFLIADAIAGLLSPAEGAAAAPEAGAHDAALAEEDVRSPQEDPDASGEASGDLDFGGFDEL
jgi:hypothetical protein